MTGKLIKTLLKLFVYYSSISVFNNFNEKNSANQNVIIIIYCCLDKASPSQL